MMDNRFVMKYRLENDSIPPKEGVPTIIGGTGGAVSKAEFEIYFRESTDGVVHKMLQDWKKLVETSKETE